MPDWPVSDAAGRRRILDDSMPFVERQLRLAPFHVRIGAKYLGVLFSALSGMLAFYGRLRSKQTADPRLSAERVASLSPVLGIYLRLIQSLATLAYMEHPSVLDALEVERGDARQLRFRDLRGAITPDTP